MPPIRAPLGQISSNIRRGPELTPIQRAKIIGAVEHSISPAEVVATYRLLDSTVRSIIQLDLERNECESKPRIGRLKKYTPYNKRIILQYVRNNPKHTYAQVKKGCNLKISHTTIKAILRANGITN
jgi:hypothetical protein